jgi:hypothetical protein
MALPLASFEGSDLHGVGTPEIRLSELAEAVNQEMLSEIQVQMLLDRCTDPATYSYAGIKQKYQITRNDTVPFWRAEKPQNRGFAGFALVPRQMVMDTETPKSRCAQISPTKVVRDPRWSIRKRLGHVSFCG